MKSAYLCPVDQSELVMSERQGVEIDYCPTCRGVWLDRGELDKIVEKNAASQSHPPMPRQPQQPPSWPGGFSDDGQSGYGRKPNKRRKSFLEDLFD